MSVTSAKSKPLNRSLLTFVILLSFIIIWIGSRLLFSNLPTPFAGNRPDNLGVTSGILAPCPQTPNCVVSQTEDFSHSIKPLTYTGNGQQAFAKLKSLIESQPRTKIIEATDNYLYAEFSSFLMGYVDDVEFYLNQKTQAIEVRSASRLGESDLGVNRQRVEKIRSLLSTEL